MIEATALRLFITGGGEPSFKVELSVGGAAAQAAFQSRLIRHGDEDQHGAGNHVPQRPCALDIGPDQDRLAGGQEPAHLIPGHAAAMPVHLRVLQEAARRQQRVEFGIREEEVVDAVLLAGTRGARLRGRHRGELRISGQGRAEDGVLAGPRRSRDHGQQGRARVGLARATHAHPPSSQPRATIVGPRPTTRNRSDG